MIVRQHEVQQIVSTFARMPNYKKLPASLCCQAQALD